MRIRELDAIAARTHSRRVMETRVLPFRSAAWPRGPRFMQPPSDEDRMVRKIRALTRVDPRLAARLERVLDEALALLAAAARP